MKLPSFTSRQKQKELFLTLLLYPDAIDAACWELGKQGEAIIQGAVTQELTTDSWEERIEAADKCVSTLEDLTKSENIHKVILGMPAEYLTEEGDVKKEVKQHIKELTRLLELTPIGFVSVYQAIIHQYKRQEGVPPSIILMGITSKGITVTLYKVGNFIGQRTLVKEGHLIGHLEDALATFTDVEILPARILLYGTDRHALEDAKRDILQYHWQQKANFLHFPKADILPGDGAAAAVSHAGASELIQTMDMSSDDVIDEEVVRDSEPSDESAIDTKSEQDQVNQEGDDNIIDSNDELLSSTTDSASSDEEMFDSSEHDNIIPATVDDIGFTSVDEEVIESKTERKRLHFGAFLAMLKSKGVSLMGKLTRGNKNQQHKSKQVKILVAIVTFFCALGLVYVLFSLVLPKATISIRVIPKIVDTEKTLSIKPDGTTSGDSISGKQHEESVNGEKTIIVTGKKTVGDSAKGTITIFNKSLVPRTLKKGTVVTTNSIDFLLDSDVSVASASESLAAGTITFGKANAAVTAKDIGSRGNVSSEREFTISGLSTSIATARNDQPFTGGTSKDITVVSRTDQDTLLKQLTAELVSNAKNGFGVGDGEQLIGETITTKVTERTFSHEIGEEAKELSVKATVAIEGTAFKETDIKSVMTEALTSNISDGFRLSQESLTVSVGTPIVSKSGDISVIATGSAQLIPSFEIIELTQQLAGKSVSEAESIIKNIQGVGSVSITVSSSLFPNRLPSRSKNLIVSIEAQ